MELTKEETYKVGFGRGLRLFERRRYSRLMYVLAAILITAGFIAFLFFGASAEGYYVLPGGDVVPSPGVKHIINYSPGYFWGGGILGAGAILFVTILAVNWSKARRYAQDFTAGHTPGPKGE